MILNENIVKRKIHDSYFLINIKQNYLNDKCYLYELNEIGYYIWSCLEEHKSVTTIVEMLLRLTNGTVLRETIKEDTLEFINCLRSEGFIQS